MLYGSAAIMNILLFRCLLDVVGRGSETQLYVGIALYELTIVIATWALC